MCRLRPHLVALLDVKPIWTSAHTFLLESTQELDHEPSLFLWFKLEIVKYSLKKKGKFLKVSKLIFYEKMTNMFILIFNFN